MINTNWELRFISLLIDAIPKEIEYPVKDFISIWFMNLYNDCKKKSVTPVVLFLSWIVNIFLRSLIKLNSVFIIKTLTFETQFSKDEFNNVILLFSFNVIKFSSIVLKAVYSY